MKKNYDSPEFELVKLQLTGNLCVESNPEGQGGGGNWGGSGEGGDAGED